MCPSAAAAANPVAVPTTSGDVPAEYAAVDAHAPSAPEVAQNKVAAGEAASNPYASRYSDFLSNVSGAQSSARLFLVVAGYLTLAVLLLPSPSASRRPPTGRLSSLLSEVSISLCSRPPPCPSWLSLQTPGRRLPCFHGSFSGLPLTASTQRESSSQMRSSTPRPR